MDHVGHTVGHSIGHAVGHAVGHALQCLLNFCRAVLVPRYRRLMFVVGGV